MKFGIAVFPGSNCDMDCRHALDVLGQQSAFIWHDDTHTGDCDALILPGGFSYGDYLRSGAIAQFSPVMSAVREFAESGKPVVGICNGFQILLESGLLPGAMRRNDHLQFICDHIYLKVENNATIFTNRCTPGQVLRIPIAHMEGNYYIPDDQLAQLSRNGQVLLRYCDSRGTVSEQANPNGSVDGIAGIMNERGNVFGLMPHPERACEAILGSEDGRFLLESVISYLGSGRKWGAL